MTIDKDKQISISIFEKDHLYLVRLKNKMRRNGLAAVIESIVNMIKELKLEGELK